MRDKKRIVRIIELIGQLWDKFPDQRFTQLIENYVGLDWNQEDDITEKCIIYAIGKAEKNAKKIRKDNARIKHRGKVFRDRKFIALQLAGKTEEDLC